jgi:hypothetical protein
MKNNQNLIECPPRCELIHGSKSEKEEEEEEAFHLYDNQ